MNFRFQLSHFRLLALCLAWLAASTSLPAAPLRVFLRVGENMPAEGRQNYQAFLRDFSRLLEDRGAQIEGGEHFPIPSQLENTDVLVLYAFNGANMGKSDQVEMEKFVQRGGGLMVLNSGLRGYQPDWFMKMAGGAWNYSKSKSYQGQVSIYFQDGLNPITQGVSNFDLEDEIYWDLDLLPSAQILAASYAPDPRNQKEGKALPSIYDIVPQMWTYESAHHRAFVSIPGSHAATLELPHYRALLLRATAWAGRREMNTLLVTEDLLHLRYPRGGPTPPWEAKKSFEIDSDFEMQLIAAEPLVQKPISLDWDHRGRMWVAETPEYPHGRRVSEGGAMVPLWGEKDPHTFKPRGAVENRPARDRISVLEDTDGDHILDSKTVFFEGLELVTSLVLYRDGAIVAQPPDVLWLRDRNGDGVAETKEVLYTGFGIFDTHAVLSNLRWGMDGWIYGSVGYSGGEVTSARVRKHFGKITAGVIRFLPNGEELEQVVSHGGNIWGMDIGWDGEVFYSQANYNHINHAVLPEWILARGKSGATTSFKNIEDHKKTFPIRDYQQAYIQIDQVGGFTAASGCCLYNGGAWPASFDYSHYISEPTVNLVHQDVVRPSGTSYLARKGGPGEFLASRDLWFRPVHQRIGPDGALYILDFYNQAAVHNDTRGPRHGPNNAAVRPDRDHYFGRIWRVQHKKARALFEPRFETPLELVQTLKHPNGWSRSTAQRLLLETSNRKAIRALDQLLAASHEPIAGRVLALWTLRQLGELEAHHLETALSSRDSALLKNALRIISEEGKPRVKSTLLLHQFHSQDERVRMLAVLALAGHPSTPEIIAQFLKQFVHSDDPWMQSAVASAASLHPGDFLLALLAREDTTKLKSLTPVLAARLAESGPDSMADFIRLLAGDPAPEAQKANVLLAFSDHLSKSAPPRLSPSLRTALEKLLRSEHIPLAAAALPLASAWDAAGNVATAVDEAVALVLPAFGAADSSQEAIRLLPALAAASGLRPGILTALLEMVGSEAPLPLQSQCIEALGAIPSADVGLRLTQTYSRLPQSLQLEAFRQIIKRPDWTRFFVMALEGGSIPAELLSPLITHRLRTYNDPIVATEAGKTLDRLRGPEGKEKEALITSLLVEVEKPGNAARGKEVFQQNCAACHTFKGEGRLLGPDLSGMGAHPKAELLGHILDPSRILEPNYIAFSIETTAGETLDGIIFRENQKSLFLRNASGDLEVPRNRIKNQRSSGLSLMPSGFESLGAEALRDLLTFLSKP